MNKPMLLKATAAVLASVTITAVPQSGLFYGNGVAQNLTLNDSATFAGANSGNTVWGPVPVAALVAGGPITMSVTTTNGLVVSAVPPGVALMVNYT